MLLKQTDQAAGITEEKVEDLSALVRRLNRPEKDRHIEVEPIQPTSNRFVGPLVGFICVVLLAAGSAILYHKQQVAVRSQYDANQKRLLAEYRLNDSWRGAALALNNQISADLEKISYMPIHNVADFQELKSRANRIKTILSRVPPLKVRPIGVGASLTYKISGLRTQLDYVVRQRGCAFLLQSDPDARSNAEWVVAESRLQAFASEQRSHQKNWGYVGSKKRKEFQDQTHRMSNKELKVAMLSVDAQLTAYYLGNPIEQMLKIPPYVPEGLNVAYARTLP